MKVDLLSVAKQLAGRPDYEPDTPIYINMRSQGRKSLPDVAESVLCDCANGMIIVFDYTDEQRLLGIEIWPAWKGEGLDGRP